MRSRGETPQETLERLNALSDSQATTSQPHASPSPAERSRRWYERFPKLGLAVTAVLGLFLLASGSMALADAVQMGRFGQATTAEVLDVHLGRGTNRVDVQYAVGGVRYRGTFREYWTAPEPGESVEIVYDTREVTHIDDSPLTGAYVRGSGAVGLGVLLLVRAVRGIRRLRGSQWLPN